MPLGSAETGGGPVETLYVTLIVTTKGHCVVSTIYAFSDEEAMGKAIGEMRRNDVITKKSVIRASEMRTV